MVLSALWDIFVTAFKKIFLGSLKHLCHLGVRVHRLSFFRSVWCLPDSWYVQWFSIWTWVFSRDLDLKPALVLFLKISFDVGYFKTLCWICHNIAFASCFAFWLEACGVLAPQPEMELAPPALQGKVPTTGPPGKSPSSLFFLRKSFLFSLC